jgi:flagellar biogenesis protein FliO
MSTALINHEINQKQAAITPVRQQMPTAARVLFDVLARIAGAIRKLVTVQRAQKQLRVCETVSLGDKRFVAVIQIEQERFLIGGATNSVSLLTRLAESASFSSTLNGLTQAGGEER